MRGKSVGWVIRAVRHSTEALPVVCVHVVLELTHKRLSKHRGKKMQATDAPSSAVGSMNSHASQVKNNELVTASLTKVDTVRFP